MPMPPMLPMMAAMMTAMAARTALFTSAFKKLKKQKKIEKKAAKKAYKAGKKVLMSRMMTGDVPQPQDFIDGRNEYSWFEFPLLPGVPELPVLIPRPGDTSVAEYVKLFKMINKDKKG